MISSLSQVNRYGLCLACNNLRMKSSRTSDTGLYNQYYQTLELEPGADQEAVRKSFINLCKKYHPDSSSSLADETKFQAIEYAYRCLQKKFSEDRWNVNEGFGEYGLYYVEKNEVNKESEPVKEYDINHTAPQHRQYLSWDGIGSGTVSQRQQQYAQVRAAQAANHVRQHRMQQVEQKGRELTLQDQRRVHKAKTRYGMERLVEDLIQESMARGDFDNLSGSGKPIRPSTFNPYVDFITHKMNEVLLDNGFTPEWITLAKEIKEEKAAIRKSLLEGSCYKSDERKWQEIISKLEPAAKALNKKIELFNLVVPILQQQKLLFNLKKESEQIPEGSAIPKSKQENSNSSAIDNGNDHFHILNIFSFLTHRK